ncbi:hypothetical protein [Sphingomonas sp.]|uniref:hypothetical protein n=1 Tax=Sphingomonas sp. TaxID=28214 RepID=UPI0035B3B3F7
MPIFSKRAAFLTLGLVGAAALASAQDRPESLLPPGFGDPAPSPTPAPAGSLPPPVARPDPPGAVVQPLPVDTPSSTPSPTPSPVDPAITAQYEMPAYARRSLDLVGPAGMREGGVDAAAFANANGRLAEQLMRRLSAPLPSRWMSILLRRTLAARLVTPDRVNGADFAAERAWLLLRMGESAPARAVVQGVDNANYTPKLYQVAMNAMLATGDPAGLCPLAAGGAAVTREGGWTVAQAMCAGLEGESAAATAAMRAVRRGRLGDDIDRKLAEKVIGAGANSRRAVTIEWGGVDRLTVWRLGLANATGVAIPAEMLDGVGPQARLWLAQSPMVPLAERLPLAERAAAQGVFSNVALVDLYGSVADDDSAPSAASAVANDLRTAYTAGDAGGRLAALRQIWGNEPRARYDRLVLTARAAARLPVVADSEDGDRLVASMLSAGLDRSAARWRSAVPAGGDGWAMILLADPDAQTSTSYDEMAGYGGSGGDSRRKQQLLFAGLAGLGRMSAEDTERAAQALDVRIGAQNSWTRALDRAVERDQPGMVVLLAAIGMQTGDWRGVPPQALYRIVSALRAVGFDGEARMIAAEAIART